MNKNKKFVGNKISMGIYKKLVAYSETTGRRQNQIMEDALSQYLDKEIPKQYEPKKD